MRLNQITYKLFIILLCLISFVILLLVFSKFGVGINTKSSLAAIYLFTSLSIFFFTIYIFGKIGYFHYLYVSIFIFWVQIPLRLYFLIPGLSWLYPTEFIMLVLFIGILLSNIIAPNARWRLTVTRFPAASFLLLIGGAVITYIVVGQYSAYEQAKIRTLCILPAVLCFLCIYYIRSMEQAKKMFWIYIVSAGILGLIYLYGPQIDPSGLHTLLDQIGEDYRVRRVIKIPMFGSLLMGSETTPIVFSMPLLISFIYWLENPSFKKRVLAFIILVICCLVLIKSMGRTGVFASVGSILVIIGFKIAKYRKSDQISTGLLFIKAVTVVTFVVGSILWVSFSSETIQFSKRFISILEDPFHIYGSVYRIERWQYGLSVLLDNLPFGVGTDGFHETLFGNQTTWFVHNFYLYLMLSFGIIGFIGFCLFFINYSKRSWTAVKSEFPDRQIQGLLGVGFVTILIISSISSNIMDYPWQILMFWIPVGITFAAVSLPDEKVANKV